MSVTPRPYKRPLSDRPAKTPKRPCLDQKEHQHDDHGEGRTHVIDSNSSGTTSRNSSSLSEYQAESASEESPERQEATRQERMPMQDIMEKLSTLFPEISENDEECNEYLSAPVGSVVQETERHGISFVLSLCQGQDAAPYHKQVQRLAILFIETADNVDVSSEKDGFWKVLYLFRRHAPNQYSFAGYFTLFHFQSPFRKPTPGVIIRICQALLLPPYQRMGLGRLAFGAVYEHAAATHDVVEVNVEDPAPAFVQLRNLADYERYMASLGDQETPDETLDVPSDLTERANALKVTPRQYQIVSEISKLRRLVDKDAEATKQYRLMVKRRLNKENREELATCRTKDEMKELLGTLYEQTVLGYRSILQRVHEGIS